MAKKEDLPVQESANVTPAEDAQPLSSKDAFLKRLHERYPDENLDDEETRFSTLNRDYDDMDTMRENDNKLRTMFETDPRAANVLTRWHEGEDPVTVLVELFGPELGEIAADPKRVKEIAEAGKKYAENIARNKDLQAQWEKNINQSLPTLEQAAKDNGWSDEEVDAAYEQLLRITEQTTQGIITPENLALFITSARRDNDVEQAMAEGEVRGRNSKIEAYKKERQAGDGVPMLSGQNNHPASAAPSSIFEEASLAK